MWELRTVSHRSHAPRYWCRVLQRFIDFKWQKQGSLSSFRSFKRLGYTALFENHNVKSLKLDISSDTTFNPPLFSMIDTFNQYTIPASSVIVKSEGQQIKQCWINYFWQNSKNVCNIWPTITNNLNIYYTSVHIWCRSFNVITNVNIQIPCRHKHSLAVKCVLFSFLFYNNPVFILPDNTFRLLLTKFLIYLYLIRCLHLQYTSFGWDS